MPRTPNQRLTVTGATSIVADPGADQPVVNASGSSAILSIEPAFTDVVHLGALNLTGGTVATLATLPDRTADDHRVLVIHGTGGITIDATSTLDQIKRLGRALSRPSDLRG